MHASNYDVSLFLAVVKGELPANHAILREVNSMCHRLPILNTDTFKEDFYNVSRLY